VHRSQALQAWVLTRYDDCLEVLRDQETFSSDARNARGAIAQAIEAGRLAYEAGPMEPRDMAQPSTPVAGTPFFSVDSAS
jgi:thiazole synthase ThiGH ThiG subunit